MNSPSVLLLHGLISTPAEFSVIRSPLQAAGLNVVAPALLGYSAETSPSANPWQHWLAAAGEELLQLSAQGPVFVGGLCIGAVLALALAEQYPDRIAGLILYSPTLFYDGWGLSRWRMFRHLGYLPGLRNVVKLTEREPFGVKNPHIRRWIAREMQEKSLSNAGAAQLPMWAVHEAERLIRHVRRQADRITRPTLVLHAREDEVASLRSAEFIMERIASPDKQLVVLENSYHMITLDNDRQQVSAETIRFVRENEAALAGELSRPAA